MKKKSKDRRKEKVKTKELLAVTVDKGTKDKILRITRNLSSFVNDALIECFKKYPNLEK